MTQTRGPIGDGRHVIVAGAGAAGTVLAAELSAAGVDDFLVLDREVVSSVFDDDSDTWALHTATGETVRCRAVVCPRRPPLVPWIPNFPGRNHFRGSAFHAAQWDADFDPTGKRIAVIGIDTSAAHHLPQLSDSATSVTVFVHAPRRVVAEMPLPTTRVKRWLRRQLRAAPYSDRQAPSVVASPIDAVTASGVRTDDGVEHCADSLIYATGFAIDDRMPDEALVGTGGLTIRQAWRNGMEPYFGVAVHGFPNYFFVSGPDVGAQARYVAACLRHMKATASTRIEVRRSSQQVFNERAYMSPAPPPRVASAFDVSSDGAGEAQTYEGAATLTIAGTDHPVQVRLAGHLDPIDGRFHWQGTVSCISTQPLPDETGTQARTATLTVGQRTAPARIIERTPWGTHSIAGVGAPPYAQSGG